MPETTAWIARWAQSFAIVARALDRADSGAIVHAGTRWFQDSRPRWPGIRPEHLVAADQAVEDAGIMTTCM